MLGEEGKVERGAASATSKTGEAREIDADGLFVAIGHDPNTRLFLDQLDHDEAGLPRSTKPGSTETNIPGVFAAGDVVDHTYRQAVTAAGTGAMAALDAERMLTAEEGHEASALSPANRSEPQRLSALAESRSTLAGWRGQPGSTYSIRTKRAAEGRTRRDSCRRLSGSSCRPPKKATCVRPSIRSHGSYIFGVFLVAVAVPEEDSSTTRRSTSSSRASGS